MHALRKASSTASAWCNENHPLMALVMALSAEKHWAAAPPRHKMSAASFSLRFSHACTCCSRAAAVGNAAAAGP